ncbi:hypothetical protein [Burkholderia sp. BCC1977]|uniref:hypothetical protein n=1 Tax=Burkholderia sp. BCC1977 TaxID=2817440 RepID=UPI002ABD8DC9|nr:hypothetical protein [Burkholderia sp. BCC1977]
MTGLQLRGLRQRRSGLTDFTGTAAAELASCLSAYLFCLSVMNHAETGSDLRPGARPRASAISGGRSGHRQGGPHAGSKLAGHAASSKFKGLP